MTGENIASGLDDSGRLAALQDTGLSSSPDPVLDRFVAMVRRVLHVPVALVSLVEADRQVFPGAIGLAEPWQQQRQTPLSHSFCQQVVTLAAPLVVTDARADERVGGNLAITDLNVIRYAGMPLTDADGQVFGSLCAIDTEVRHWTPAELDLLSDLAAACSETLRLRIATRDARDMAQTALAWGRQVKAAFDRSQLLLRPSVALASTNTLTDVVNTVRDLVADTLDPAYVGVSLLDQHGAVSLQSGRWLPVWVAERWNRYPQAATTPTALVASTGVPVLLPDLQAVTAQVPDAAATFADMGWQSCASMPLPGPDGTIGALTLVWKQPRRPDATEQTVLVALAGYVAQALQRADLLDSRDQVAALPQQAMLSDLPDVAPLQLAARYEPAAHGAQVGGDWYDAVRLDDDVVALVVGDVTGHDMRAAARMGHLRSMLRAYLADRHEPPSALLRRLDQATLLLGDRVPTTAVLAYVKPTPAGTTCTGRTPDTLTAAARNRRHRQPLTGRDALLGALRHTPRTSHTRDLPPGSTALLYTDGLVETRTDALDERKHQLRDALGALADAPLPDLLDEVLNRMTGDEHEDDIAMLAMRTPPGDDEHPPIHA